MKSGCRAGPSACLAALVTVCASCGRDDGVDAGTLHVLPRPDPATMEAAVADVLLASWDELEDARMSTGTTPEALAGAYATYGLSCFGNGLSIPAETAFEHAVRLAPDDARWVYFLALLRESTGELDRAASGFESVLALRPGDLPALIRLGDTRLEQARVEDAQAAFAEALAIAPQSAAAHYGLGRVASARENPRLAVTHFEAALTAQPAADRIHYLLGLAWRNLGDEERARGHLAQRGTSEPGFPDPLFDAVSEGRARIGGLWSHMHAAAQAYVDEDYALAAAQYGEATRDHPTDPRAWQSLAMALAKTGDVRGAQRAYRKTLDLEDENAGTHHNLGQLLMSAGHYDEAAEHLERAVALDPQAIAFHVTLAELRLAADQPEAALAHYEDALALDARSGELIVARAELLMRMDQAPAAQLALASAAADNPQDTQLRTAHASLLADTGKIEAARREIRDALASAGDDAGRARIHFAQGRIELGQGDGETAIKAFESALQANPDHNSARLTLARTLARAQRFQSAFAAYDAYLERMPASEGVRIEAATAALFMGSGSDARRILEIVADAPATSPRLHSALARLLALSAQPGVRDPVTALRYAQQAYDADPAISYGETLALCLAAGGRFAEAQSLQSDLVAEAEKAGTDATLVARMHKNLARYGREEAGRLPLDPG